jgi:formylmethanofuran dehydrogenase subunit E
MALLGCRLIDLDDPRSPDQIKKLIVYVEMDRCATDAVGHVTGARLGRRSLKFIDYGIMAASFVNLETGEAYRVVSTEESRDLVRSYASEVAGKHRQQLEGYQRMPDSLLFRVQKVKVRVSEFDLPGPTRKKVTCGRCGQVIRDSREVAVDGKSICRVCAYGGYFQEAIEIPWSEIQPGSNPSPMRKVQVLT